MLPHFEDDRPSQNLPWEFVQALAIDDGPQSKRRERREPNVLMTRGTWPPCRCPESIIWRSKLRGFHRSAFSISSSRSVVCGYFRMWWYSGAGFGAIAYQALYASSRMQLRRADFPKPEPRLQISHRGV